MYHTELEKRDVNEQEDFGYRSGTGRINSCI